METTSKRYMQGNIYSIYDSCYILTGFNLNKKEYAMLVSVTDGNRWADPIEVNNFFELTEDEFLRIWNRENMEYVKLVKTFYNI